MQELSKLLLAVIGIAFAAIAMVTWGRFYWNKRITHWARQRGYVLIECRGAAFFEGPGAMLRTANQTTFRVKVRNADGRILAGWLVFGKNWNPMSSPDELVEEKWD